MTSCNQFIETRLS